MDGSGGSWSSHIISTSGDGANSVFAIDMDGDGDIDVLSASRDDDTIARYQSSIPQETLVEICLRGIQENHKPTP